jgi:large subunit ribosomal protein L19
MIKEGDKKRVQFFEGIIISKHKSSIDTTITIRRIFQGIGIERTFPLYSPQIKSIKIIDDARAKRAKLFYLRDKIGKAAMKVQGR